MDRMKDLRDTPDIKIITGIRRSGKSNLMQAYIKYLADNFKDINIIFVDFMNLEYEKIKEYHALHKYIEDRYEDDKQNYVFVDEVQLYLYHRFQCLFIKCRSGYVIYWKIY